MSIFRETGIGDFTRGGQTTIHFFMMIFQVFKKFLKVCMVIWFLISLIAFYVMSDPTERYLGFKWVESWFFIEGLKDTSHMMNIALGDGDQRRVNSVVILNNKAVINNFNGLYYKAIYSFILGAILMFVAAFFIMRFVHRTGKNQGKEEHVRGGKLVDISELKKITKKTPSLCNLSLCDVRLPKGADVAHILLLGSPGTGKSVNYRELLTGIRKAKKRAIIYDPSGEFISNFYREGKDIILNPLDARGSRWDVWGDCSASYDYIQLAESFIHDTNKGDPFWIKGARTVFASTCEELAKHPNPTMELLADTLLRISYEELIEKLKGTDASSIINESAIKTAANVRAILLTNIQSLRFLRDDGDRFSIRQWVANESDDSWVFISSQGNHRAMLRPLISGWIDIASNALLSLSPDHFRRIFLLIDELPSLHKLPSLEEFLAESRKYGGCGIIGVQNYSQLISRYSREGADSIAGLCSTWAVFRCNDESAGATWASKNLGSTEALETSEGISYGSNEIRDGVSLSRQKRLRPIVLPSEISNLPDLHGFIRFGRGFPVAKFVCRYRKFNKVCPAFIPNEGANASEDNSKGSGNEFSIETRIEPTIPENMSPDYSEDVAGCTEDSSKEKASAENKKEVKVSRNIADDIGVDV